MTGGRGSSGLALLTVAVLATACGVDRSASPPVTTTVTASPPTSPPPPPDMSAEQRAVWDQYRAFWRAYFDFGRKDGQADPFDEAEFDAALGRYATGQQYKDLKAYLSRNRARRIVFIDPGLQHDSTPIVEIAGAEARVVDCVHISGGVFDLAENRPVGPPKNSREVRVARMVLEAGTWKVADLPDDEGGDQCVE